MATNKFKKSRRGRVPNGQREKVMDMTRAMGILGLSSTRWAEKTKGKNPKEVLDKAHFSKLMQIQKKKVRFPFFHISQFNFSLGQLGQRIKWKGKASC